MKIDTNFLNRSENEPYLVILSQPEGEFRFRYASELKHGNSHGNLMVNYQELFIYYY